MRQAGPHDRPGPRPLPTDDPVRARRAQVARAASMAQRIGYALFAVAVVAFFIGFFAGFTARPSP